MSPYLLIIFILTADGNVSALSSPQLYIGADLCQSKMEEFSKAVVAESGALEARAVCIDSKLFPGVPS